MYNLVDHNCYTLEHKTSYTECIWSINNHIRRELHVSPGELNREKCLALYFYTKNVPEIALCSSAKSKTILSVHAASHNKPFSWSPSSLHSLYTCDNKQDNQPCVSGSIANIIVGDQVPECQVFARADVAHMDSLSPVILGSTVYGRCPFHLVTAAHLPHVNEFCIPPCSLDSTHHRFIITNFLSP